MPRRKTITGPDGHPHQVNEIGFRPDSEHWNTYLLDDGTVLRVKLIVKTVYKADELRNPDGDPVYLIESENTVVASVPNE